MKLTEYGKDLSTKIILITLAFLWMMLLFFYPQSLFPYRAELALATVLVTIGAFYVICKYL